jgi:hypothetical protein
MRIRFFLLGGSVVLFGGAFAVQACGGTSTSDTVTDAGGADVVDASIKDTSVADVKDAAPQCDPNKDLFQSIPDASIADGGSSVGTCLGCATTKCKSDVDACKMDCACQGLAGTALECFAKTQSQTCALSFLSAPKSTQAIGLSLVTCLQSSCPVECPAGAFVDAGDGGDGG